LFLLSLKNLKLT